VPIRRGFKKRMPLEHPSLTPFEPQLMVLLELVLCLSERTMEAVPITFTCAQVDQIVS
jgi:hypothetical protein